MMANRPPTSNLTNFISSASHACNYSKPESFYEVKSFYVKNLPIYKKNIHLRAVFKYLVNYAISNQNAAHFLYESLSDLFHLNDDSTYTLDKFKIDLVSGIDNLINCFTGVTPPMSSKALELFSTSYGTTDIPTTLSETISNFKTNKTFDTAISLLVLYSHLLLSSYKSELTVQLFNFLLTLTKTDNITIDNLTKRSTILKKALPDQTILTSPLTLDDIKQVWSTLHIKFTKGYLDPEDLLNNVSQIMVDLSIDNIALTPLLQQAEFRNMTVINIILTAISSFGDFPWQGLIQKNPVIQQEVQLFKTYLSDIENDKFAGYKTAGVASAFITLGFVCLNLHVIAGGSETLKNYRGAISGRTGVANKEYFLKLITDYSRDNARIGGSYEELKMSLANSQGSMTELQNAITKMIKPVEEENAEVIIDEIDRVASKKRKLDDSTPASQDFTSDESDDDEQAGSSSEAATNLIDITTLSGKHGNDIPIDNYYNTEFPITPPIELALEESGVIIQIVVGSVTYNLPGGLYISTSVLRFIVENLNTEKSNTLKLLKLFDESLTPTGFLIALRAEVSFILRGYKIVADRVETSLPYTELQHYIRVATMGKPSDDMEIS